MLNSVGGSGFASVSRKNGRREGNKLISKVSNKLVNTKVNLKVFGTSPSGKSHLALQPGFFQPRKI